MPPMGMRLKFSNHRSNWTEGTFSMPIAQETCKSFDTFPRYKKHMYIGRS